MLTMVVMQQLEKLFNQSYGVCIRPHHASGVSRLQKLVGPISINSLARSNFRDTRQNSCIIINLRTRFDHVSLAYIIIIKCKYLALSANYHVLTLKVLATYLHSHLLLVWFWTIFRFCQTVPALISSGISHSTSLASAGAYTTNNKCPAQKMNSWLHSVATTFMLFIYV